MLCYDLKKEYEDFKNSTKWICKKPYANYDDKVKGYCHITEKYRGFVLNECNVNVI